jgi:hypothetical protein
LYYLAGLHQKPVRSDAMQTIPYYEDLSVQQSWSDDTSIAIEFYSMEITNSNRVAEI